MRVSSFTLLLLLATISWAQDSVDVYFSYKPSSNPSIVYLPGEFNGWANNNSGVISSNPLWNMTKDLATGTWYKWQRLQIGGPSTGGGMHGAYQYKINENGCSSCWLNDPLNHYVNTSDNSNSYVYIKDPTIFHFVPNQRSPIVNTSFPAISAYIFPKLGTTLDTSTLSLSIDGTLYTGLGAAYNFITRQLTYTLPTPLPNGSHKVVLYAATNSDSVTFTTRGGFVQLLNEFPFTTLKNTWTINGTVGDSSVTTIRLIRNGVDTFSVSVASKAFSYSAPLLEGINSFKAGADSSGVPVISTPIVILRKVNHSPAANISFSKVGENILFSTVWSTDPDSGQTDSLSFLWLADPSNPEALAGVDGATEKTLTIARPTATGEYFFTLVASDPTGNKDTTRNYFSVDPQGNCIFPTIASNPAWAQKARVYFLFPKAASSNGTLNAAAQRLQNIKDLGFNVVWLMPIMKNAYPIDNNFGPGYNIVDFYNVAPEYGTNQDFKNFVAQAHTLGLKVILDITPNHTSRFHTWSVDAHTFKSNSPYWNWYEHAKITANTNGLGDCLDPDNFNYYCGFSDQLLNYNWSDDDARAEMINVYKYWIQQFGVDGYRFDVYWGPHRRYGEQYMGKPVRDALKHLKPDILLLAEDDGTGSGTETIYADYVNGGINGGVDAAYDFKLLFNQISNFEFSSSAINSLHSEIDNAGYYPGKNALYMRFMESQDADRIVYNYSNQFTLDASTTFMREMPMASVIFTAPGFPMIWNGQEVGWGYGITGSKENRARSVINWNYQGKGLLSPHYQKLATIRGQFAAFTQHKKDTNNDNAINSADSSDFVRVVSSNSIVYAFSRPYWDQNGLTVVNFSGSEQSAILNLAGPGLLQFSGGVQPGSLYYLNNLYANSREQVLGSGLDSVAVTLPAYGTAIYTVSLTPDSVTIENPILDVKTIRNTPRVFALSQNYPNPFNPVTTIGFEIPKRQYVTLKVYDVLGKEIATLIDNDLLPGKYETRFDANSVASGVYFYRLTAGERILTHKMLLLR